MDHVVVENVITSSIIKTNVQKVTLIRGRTFADLQK